MMLVSRRALGASCAALLITAAACGDAPAAAPPDGFSAFLDQVGRAPADEKAAAVDAYLATVPSFPLIEGQTGVRYLYRGAASSVTLSGDVNAWDQAGWPFTHLAGTDLWYLAGTYESDARLDYKFIVDGAWVLDPRNPRTSPGEFGDNSELRMPGLVDPPELAVDPAIPHGTVITTSITSALLGNTRTVKIYLPPGYDAAGTARYPVILFHDGLEFLSLAHADNTIDNLIHAQRMQPVVGVFVPPVDRHDEYVGTKEDQFVAFVSQELWPMVTSTYRVAPGASNAATMGISNGGDVSQYLGLRLSSTFGKVAAFSPAGDWPQALDGYLASPHLDQRYYMDVGTYDLPHFLVGTETFVDEVLVAKGYEHQFHTWHQGHSWANWRMHLGLALEYLFPASAAP